MARKKRPASRDGDRGDRCDHRLTVIESLPAADGYHTLVEAWGTLPPCDEFPTGKVLCVMLTVEESPAWIPFGSLIARESETHVRVQQREGDPGQLVKLTSVEVMEVTPEPRKTGEPYIELVGGGPLDGSWFAGDDAKALVPLEIDHGYCFTGAVYTEIDNRPDDDRRLVFVGMASEVAKK